MVETERAFAARALVVGWKQAFLEYFADDAIGFQDGAMGLAKDQIAQGSGPAEGLGAHVGAPLRRHLRQRRARIPDRPGARIRPRDRPPRHQTYASVWKRQRDGTFKVILDVGVPTPQAVPFAPGVQRAPFANRFSGDYDDRTPPLSAADGVLNSALRSSQSRGYRGRLAPEARAPPSRRPAPGRRVAHPAPGSPGSRASRWATAATPNRPAPATWATRGAPTSWRGAAPAPRSKRASTCASGRASETASGRSRSTCSSPNERRH